MEENEDSNIPKSPDLLHEGAQHIYDKLYKILLAENRGDSKYDSQVAIAANALYFYQLAMASVPIFEGMSTKAIGESIRALNSASMEWSRASRALLLTPESELKASLSSGENGEPPPTMADVMGELMTVKSKNDNYSVAKEKNKKTSERASKTRDKTGRTKAK